MCKNYNEFKENRFIEKVKVRLLAKRRKNYDNFD